MRFVRKFSINIDISFLKFFPQVNPKSFLRFDFRTINRSEAVDQHPVAAHTLAFAEITLEGKL